MNKNNNEEGKEEAETEEGVLGLAPEEKVVCCKTKQGLFFAPPPRLGR